MRGYIDFPLSTLSIGRKRLVQALARLGVGPRKSKTVRFPSVSPDLHNHVVRGIFDGDGTIGLYKKRDGRRHRRFGFAGGLVVGDVAEIISEATGIWKAPRFRARESGSAYELYYGSRCFPVLLWIYKGATIYLDRKYNIAVRFLEEANPGAQGVLIA